MITVTKDGEEHAASVSTRPPSIYLDHWALRLFSSDSKLRQRFLACFKTKGTLLFSWANTLEVSRNTGTSADDIRRFLTDIDEQWFPVEINPIKVIKSEIVSGSNSPCFAAGFLEAYYPHIHNGPLSLGTLVDLLSDDEVKAAAKAAYEKLTKELVRHFRWERASYRARRDPSGISRFHPDKPAEFVYNGLMELIAKDSFRITGQHVLDFCHAVVSLAYSDFVLLDPHWRELAKKLDMPTNRVRVYSKPQLDQFLEDLEQFAVSLHEKRLSC